MGEKCMDFVIEGIRPMGTWKEVVEEI